MTLREATVLIRLYEACQDIELRRWALQQVPELGDVAVTRPIEVAGGAWVGGRYRPR